MLSIRASLTYKLILDFALKTDDSKGIGMYKYLALALSESGGIRCHTPFDLWRPSNPPTANGLLLYFFFLKVLIYFAFPQ